MKYFKTDVFDRTDMLELKSPSECLSKKVVPALAASGCAGLIAGVIVTLFNVLLDVIAEYSGKLVELINENKEFIPLYILLAALVGLAAYFLIKILPEARGSGIPRSEAMLIGKKKLSWWKMILGSITGSVLSFTMGLSVGAEGPSVQIGSGIGLGVEKIFGADSSKRRYVANGGAAAGISTAFGAPFTGIIFVQEEVQRSFNPLMVACACMSALCALGVSVPLNSAFGIGDNFFNVPFSGQFPNEFLWIAPVIGVACAIFAFLFSNGVLWLNKRASKTKIPPYVLIIGMFALTALINSFLTQSAGSGLGIVNGLINNGFNAESTGILFVVKTALVLACFFTGVTGGMMVPMLSLGALFGALLGFAFLAAGLPTEFFAVVVLISMCAFFGSTICAPITVVALFIETTGAFGAMLPLVLSIFAAQITGKILRQKAMYDKLAEAEWDKNFLP